MKQLEDILMKGTRQERIKVAGLFRQGYQMINNKYGSMVDYAWKNQDSEMCNNEIIRRDKLLYRYVRMYK